MRRTLFQKAICLLLSATLLFGAFVMTSSAGSLKETGVASSLEQMQAFLNAGSYDEYIAEYEATPGLTPHYIDVVGSLVSGGDGVKVSESDLCADYASGTGAWEEFGDRGDTSVYLPATGKNPDTGKDRTATATWEFTLDKAQTGWYYIMFEYYNCNTVESSVSSIERKFYIDNKIPFTEVSTITMPKTWKYDNVTTSEREVPGTPDSDATVRYEQIAPKKDKKTGEIEAGGYYKIVTEVKDGVEYTTTYKISQDINGNSMAPLAQQHSTWNTYFCQDTTGYYHGYFMFYLVGDEGGQTHTITLESQREPVVIGSIALIPVDDAQMSIPTYEEVKAGYQQNGYTSANGGQIVNIQGEFPDYVSDSSVTSGNNNSSAANEPTRPNAQIFNVIGETSYSSVGQYAAYKFTVTESGLYKFGMRYLQSALQGMYVCRTIKLAGGQYGLENGTPTVPFMEAYNAQFNYSEDWQTSYLTDGSGEAFEFYFEAGVEYTLYLECSLGTLKNLIKRVEDVMLALNAAYLRIIQLTGPTADSNRDYNFYGIMPEVLVTLRDSAIELDRVAKEFEELSGEKGAHIVTLDTVARLLDTMYRDRGYELAANLSNLKSYLGTLGTWINSSKATTLLVDAIIVAPADADEEVLPRRDAGFFRAIWYEISSFWYSFFTDYDAMGLTKQPSEDDAAVEVWIAAGRDQSSIWRSMIDAEKGFTDRTGAAVNLKLVVGSSLLPSILADKGPDVYMGLDASTIINYAIRDAVVGVSELDVTNTTYYTYKTADGYETVGEYRGEENLSFTSETYDTVLAESFVPAALDTITLLGKSYGIPLAMGFAMMFYRTDVLARLGEEVPETWTELLALLPVLQANNMEIGLSYGEAINFILYQRGGNMWHYTEYPEYAGARIGLDTDIAYEAFDFVCRLYTDYSFPVSYSAANRFRTGELPIDIESYAGFYNQMVVYATEISGLWEFSSIPGWYVAETDETEEYFNYNSIAGISAAVMLHGCDNELAAWQYMQWMTSAEAQAEYGNRMVALIGPAAKYETANIHAIDNLSWTASEKLAIKDQIAHLSSVVNYPGSYIISRYTNFAFLEAVNAGANPQSALSGYIDAINTEIIRKREEYDLETVIPEHILSQYNQ